MRAIVSTSLVLVLTTVVWADLASGPKQDDKAPELKVFAVSGEPKDKELDYVAKRKDKPTVYVFVQAEHWGRPMFRFIKKLDEVLPEVTEEAAPVAVWLSEKPEDSKEYVGKITQYFKATSLTVYSGEKTGPKDWGINLDAHVTAVVVHKGKVVASFGYQSVNETDADAIKDTVKKTVGK